MRTLKGLNRRSRTFSGIGSSFSRWRVALIAALFPCCLHNPLALAQWIPYSFLNPYPTSSAIFGASAPSVNHFVGVTAKGEAVLTTDGGTTWLMRPISDGIYRGVKFLDDRVGWAVGAGDRRLHKTSDGGFTWVPSASGRDTTMYGVDFVSASTGWAVGYMGFIIRTTDGGATWLSQSIRTAAHTALYAVDALDQQTLFVVGDDDLCIKSSDAGASWVKIPPIFSDPTNFRAVLFTDSLTGFVGGFRSRLARTTDGGKSWTPVNNPGGDRTLYSIAFNSKDVGLAVGSSSEVLRSIDGGRSWRKLLLQGMTTLTFYSVTFGDDRVAYIARSNGALYKSIDAGATWH